MRFTRIITGTITAGLVGLVPVAVSSPAQAVTENRTTAVTIAQSYGESTLEYGSDISFTGAVVDNTGASVYEGTVTLYVATTANPTPTPVETVDASGYLSFADVKAVANAQYEAVYSGATAVDTYQNNYAASETAPYVANVFRKLSIKNPKGSFIKGKVAPTYKKKKIVIFKKVGKSYKKFKTLKTDKRSSFAITLPASRKRTYFRITVPGDSNFVTAVQEGSTIAY